MTARRPTAARSDNSSDSSSDALAKEGAGAAFYPPKQKPLMARLVQSISYGLAQVLYKFQLSVSEESVGKVRAVDNARLVFVCNHPTMEDGITLFVLSARLGQLFHYIVAYESFKGLMGWFIQRLGCYSIRRGMGDRASISQTMELIKSPNCRLVIFPEGGCSYQNDTIMPFRPGAIQLPMAVLAQLAKKAETPEQIPDLYIVPLSLKYRYRQPMQRIIDNCLTRLEASLKIGSGAESDVKSHVETDPAQSDYQRLRAIAHQVILRLEAEAALTSDPALDWNQRIERLKQFFVHQCESAMGLDPLLNAPLRERVYRVQALLEERLAAHTGEGPMALNGLDAETLYWNTIRLLNFDAIYDGYVAESPTPERFLDTLMRLEREVFHQKQTPQPKAFRKACFYIGDPINLKAYLADYQRDRSKTSDRLAEQLRQIMQTNLNRLNAR
jgi:hypothetical protein